MFRLQNECLLCVLIRLWTLTCNCWFPSSFCLYLHEAVCWNMVSPCFVYMYSQQIGLSHWDPYAVHRGGCLELYYCNMVEWFWWHSSLISTTNGFLQCFNTVGLVILPVKIVHEMTYYVSSATLNPTHSQSHSFSQFLFTVISFSVLSTFWVHAKYSTSYRVV